MYTLSNYLNKRNTTQQVNVNLFQVPWHEYQLFVIIKMLEIYLKKTALSLCILFYIQNYLPL
jgi:hypothetical protein